MLTFIPASTRLSASSQNATNSRLVDVAAKHHPLKVRRVAGVFHTQVVLVGEKVRQLFVFTGFAEHARHRDGGLLERIGPVFGADPIIEQRMLGRGDVTHGVDVGSRWCAAMRRRARRRRRSTGRPRSASSMLGCAPTAIRTRSAVTVDPSPNFRPVALPSSVVISLTSAPGGDPHRGRDAVGEYLADFLTDRADQGRLGGLDHGDVDAALAGACRDLQPDPPGADHRQRRSLFKGGIQV